MQSSIKLLIMFLIILQSCSDAGDPNLSAFKVYCEMVANGAKPVALSQPMPPTKMNQYWDKYQEIARSYEVSLFRETDFPLTQLFPIEVTEGMDVAIIYTGNSLVRYEQFKDDLNDLEAMEASRRFGRLLGYDANGINQLLIKNTDFRTLNSFGIEGQVTHLYYPDLEEAIRFYRDVLGLRRNAKLIYSIGDNTYLALHKHDDQHPPGQARSTAIALLTDQLPQWYEYVKQKNIPIKYTYKPKEGGPHDGFVAIDPGGYLLEFEEFKQHPENERFMASLAGCQKVNTAINDLGFFASITWTYHRDLLQMQSFYEEVLGFEMVADQGWTKIYQTSDCGFIGLVDEVRGMEDYADLKSVEIEWKIRNLTSAASYFKDKQLIGPEQYTYLLTQ